MANIFQTSADLRVDFSRLAQCLVNRGRSRLLSQFRDSKVLVQLLDAISEECQELYDAQLAIQHGRTLAEATGEQLNIIGMLVGANKTLYNYDLLPWMSPDHVEHHPDSAPLWVTNAPQTGNTEAPDSEWRRIIFAKIFKNHMRFASIPEIRYFIKMMTGIKMSLAKTGIEEMVLVAPAQTDPALIRFLLSLISDTQVDSSYMLPVPPDVKLLPSAVLLVIQDPDGEANSFAPDQEAGKPDKGRATVIITIGGL